MSSQDFPACKPRVALFNPIFAHYRQGLLRELLARSDLQVSLYADSESNHDGVPDFDLSASSRFTRTRCVKLLRFTWQRGVVKAACADYDVYIFLGNPEWVTSWVGALIARLRGRRVLFWTHGWKRRDSLPKRLVRNSLYRLGHGLLLYGERARQDGIERGFAPGTLYVMYNSLDFDQQQLLRSTVSNADSVALRTELFGNSSVPIVIATARLTETKRFDLLIRALGLLLRSGKQVNLILVGDGPQRNELSALADKEHVQVAFTGACYDEQRLAQLYQCANVTVSPGNVGLTCMHSLGYGVPVITHDNPDDQMPEWEAIVPGVTGSVFAQNNTAALAAAIDQWTQSVWLPEAVRTRCITSLMSRYHPRVQCEAIVRAVAGEPAKPIAALLQSTV